ncbi:sulfite exporter TauE/SafE family protein [Stutzerimonas tarimensis]|uniref:Probable membrane transporter protein n=1 Tax=Stutzerimonas tarimensis TaxID=1507735 RepID=A0ABV7TA26_9GAMM
MFGIGGGLIAIPVLGVFFGLDQQIAQGTALVMVVPNVMLALWRYHQRNRIDLRHVLALALPGFLLAILGSLVAVSLDAERMRSGFVVFLVALAAYNLFRVFWQAPRRATGLAERWPWLTLVGAGSGFFGGLFAVGGSVIATPLLTSLFGASQVVAQGLALSLAAPSTTVALVTYGLHGEVLWSVGLALAVGGLLSISLGVRLAHAMPEAVLKCLFSAFLLVSAFLLR